MEKKKNTKIFVIIGVLIAAICISVVAVVILGSSSDNIYGTWNISQNSMNQYLKGYPENDLIFNEDGTFYSDGKISGTFYMDENYLTIDPSGMLYSTQQYEYKLSGNKLTLKNINGEAYPEIHYEKVN